ncbi:Ig-like domain-containing protein [Alkalibacter mobilis]|uniref:Ig-like domain-containing protein n=1 Tax=Alkalibacter mobilis TaxID=2787712 RepID=UPI00189D4B0A|nr:Ig-like domain-containing protein [Alkalibacter mobilis]MBF7097315.1 Ig-like domain-containing protein [Alkalibacter mobilis]
MKTIKKILALLLVCLLMAGGTVVASGDGSGGGQEDPLELVTTSVENGAESVALDTSIRLEFNKNVTFDTVRESNIQAFSVKDQDGNAVEIEVVLAESVNKDERNFANIEFAEELRAGMSYTLIVDTALESKSGDKMAEPLEITFTTQSDSDDQSGVGDQEPENQDSQEDNPSLIIFFVGIGAVVAFAGFKLYKRQNN